MTKFSENELLAGFQTLNEALCSSEDGQINIFLFDTYKYCTTQRFAKCLLKICLQELIKICYVLQ